MKKKKNAKSVISNVLSNWQIWGIPLFGRDVNEVLRIVGERLLKKEKKVLWVATVNPEFVIEALKDRQFIKILQSRTEMNVVDGIGLIWAREIDRRSSIIDLRKKKSKITEILKRLWRGFWVGIDILKGKKYAQVVSGADLMSQLCKMGKKVFFLGGWDNRAEKTANNLRSVIYDLRSDWCRGEPEVSNEKVLEKIRKFKPEILFVAYGMKKQEMWIDKNLEELEKAGVKVVMGVGRSFDYYSGDLPRAPMWVRRIGFEWLYSLIKEPKRWRRQLNLFRFVWGVVVE